MPTTIFTDSLTADDNVNDGFSIRNVLVITGGAQGQVRVTFKASGSAAFKVDHCSIGISNGTSANTTTTPTELTFSGGSGFSIALGQSITSDFVNFSGFISTDKLVVIFDVNSAAGSGNYSDDNASTGNTNFFQAATVSWNVAAPTGFSSNINVNSGVSLIEVQPAPGGGTVVPQSVFGYVENEW